MQEIFNENINIVPINIELNENQEPILSGRELHQFLEVSSNYTTWFDRMLKYGFEENIDYISWFPKMESELHGGQNKKDHIIKLDMAKEIAMIQRSEKGKQARRYFIECEKKLKSNTLALTEKEQLAINILNGGSKALESSLRLVEIETEEIQKQEEEKRKLLQLEHKEEMQKERKSRNELLQATTVVELLRDRLNLPRLTTTLLNQWLAEEKGLGEYVKLEGDKKRRFIPNETFLSWVSIEGYSFTGKTVDGRGTHVKYSYAMVDRITEHHAYSLMKYVKINTLNEHEIVEAI